LKSLGSNSSLDFAEIVATLKKKGSSAGFQQLRDLLLLEFSKVKKELGAVNVINLAINCDKHSILAKVAESKTKDKQDHEAYDKLQDYLSGKAPLFTVTPMTEEEVEQHAADTDEDEEELTDVQAGETPGDS